MAAKSEKYVAVYARVSSKRQDTKSQQPDLDRWISSQDQPVKRFVDKMTGTTMDRPGWNALWDAVNLGQVGTIVCWRLDRLGRTASGLTKLFDELRERKINLVSLKDGFDLGTASGRLFANLLASIAQFESELKAERVRAGQAVARAAGKRWGGSKAGKPKKLNKVLIRTIRRLRKEGETLRAIGEVVHLSKPTIQKVLAAETK